MRQILRKHGLEGYAICWILREMVAKEGEKYRLKAEKDWKTTLCELSCKSVSQVDEWLNYQAEINAIDRKALEIGDLYIPKLKEYSDDYTKKLRRHYVESTLRLDKNTLDKIILHYITIKKFPVYNKDGSKDKELEKAIWVRNVKTAKKLAILAKGKVDSVIEAINWFGNICDKKGLSWTLETIEKWYPEFLVKGKTDSYDALLAQFNLKKE
jgi:hypothetical protein